MKGTGQAKQKIREFLSLNPPPIFVISAKIRCRAGTPPYLDKRELFVKVGARFPRLQTQVEKDLRFLADQNLSTDNGLMI